MVRRDGAEAKKERMEQIARKIQAALYIENPILFSRTIAQIEYDFGLTKAKIIEYLATLQNLGQFTIDEENDRIQKCKELKAMCEKDVLRIRQIAREEFWELLDSEVLPVLKDYAGIRLDVARIKEEPEATIPEDTFNPLKWEDEEGAKLGAYQVAEQKPNLPDNFRHAFQILRANNTTIAASFHPKGYVYRYWIYSEKYQDRIFRKKLSELEARKLWRS